MIGFSRFISMELGSRISLDLRVFSLVMFCRYCGSRVSVLNIDSVRIVMMIIENVKLFEWNMCRLSRVLLMCCSMS